jgi:SET domain-containing protein
MWDDITEPEEECINGETKSERHEGRTTRLIYRNNMMNPTIEIRKSLIKKMNALFPWGAFAKIGIYPKTILLLYKGEHIVAKINQTRYGNKPHSSNEGRYVFDNEDGTFTDGEDPRYSGIARFINATGPGEESEANVEVFRKDGRLYVESIKYIHAGQELVYDYGSQYKWDEGEQLSTFTTLQPRKKQKKLT